jgi:uncharacterized protein (DUF362 family)
LTGSLLAGVAPAAKPALGIPGPFRGRVVAVRHPGSIITGQYQRAAVRAMIRKGMMELTGAPSATEAWRFFFQPGDVVGIKLNPVGLPHLVSAAEVFQEIVAGLRDAGVKPPDIVAFERYRNQFLAAGFEQWLPEGVRWSSATEKAGLFQLDMEGYDRDQFVELPLVPEKADPRDSHVRRSYVTKFLTKEVNKLINLGVLKHHQSAGVTIALKNLSHGLVNNVARSHLSRSANACGVFIPAVIDLPVFRQKVVLHIIDGIKAAYHGGPGRTVAKYLWEHQTLYFATDPVAVDRVGWTVIDDQRGQRGMPPLALAPADEVSVFVRMQPEHVELAGALGLGESDEKKIELRTFELA